jgi:seryl-tRNA synthetase
METLRFEFGKINKEIADKKKSSKGKDQCEDLVEQSKEKKAAMERQTIEAEDLKKQVEKKLGSIGNILHKDVPIFKDEDNNLVTTTWGSEKIKDLPIVPFEEGRELGKLHHHEIMALLNIVEFERGTKVAGHRGFFLRGNGVLLN